MTKVFTRRLLASVVLVISAFALTGFGCKQQRGAAESLDRNLVVWGLWQESEHMKSAVDAFKAQYGVEVEYKKIASVASYERELISALAEGRGPDVFVIHNTWVESQRGLLTPAPTDIVDERAVHDEFVDVVAQDLVRDARVYALPTSVDTLALYYNKDLLNAAAVARPPATWTDMQRAVERLTQVNRVGAIQQSGVALGTAANVNRAPDILQLLMLQSGIPILNEDKTGVELTSDIAERALTFYTDFANKAKKVYTWDLQQDFSIDAFSEGDTAMMLNYSYHIPTIKAKNPRLNFAVAPIPQIADSGTKVNFAAYWPFAVSSSTPVPTVSWQFVRFLTSQPVASLVNQAQQVPPAHRASVVELERDPTLGVFAEQTLTARTWARPDIAATDSIFTTMIDGVVTGTAPVGEALKRAEDQLNQLWTQP